MTYPCPRIRFKSCNMLRRIDPSLFKRCSFHSILGNSRAWSSTSTNVGEKSSSQVKKWVETLDPILKKKVQYFQNEVIQDNQSKIQLLSPNISTILLFIDHIFARQLHVRSVESEWPVNPDTLTISDYQQLFTKSSRDRKRYYNYLYKNRLETNERNVWSN